MQRVRAGHVTPRKRAHHDPSPPLDAASKPGLKETVPKSHRAGETGADALRRAARELKRGEQGTPPGGPGETSIHQAPAFAQQAFDEAARGAEGQALQALQQAGLDRSVVDRGPKRTTGLGITIPLMVPKPGVELAAFLAKPLEADLSSLRIAISADHGAYGCAERTAQLLKSLGVGSVSIIAPKEGERMNYGVSTHAALELYEAGKADRVISFCGNGLGALDVCNLHAFGKAPRIAPPVYGDNLWKVVQGKERGAEVLALGARLLAGNDDVLKAYLKAFLDKAPAPTPTAAPQHGVSSSLIDPKPERIAGRTLKSPIVDEIKLTAGDKARIAARPTTIYFNPEDAAVPAQMKALKKWLPPSVRFVAWDGQALPDTKAGERTLLLSGPGCPAVSTHPWGFFTPEDEPNSSHRVHRAEHVNSVKSFARDTGGPGGLTLDLPCAALTDAACGGADHDLLKLLVKTFLLTEPSEAPPHKALYGEALQFGAALLETGSIPPELASWGAALEQARAGARSA